MIDSEHTSHYTEADLIAMAQQDSRQFKLLYEQHYEPIYRFLLRRTGDEHLTTDLAAQTFVKALSNIKKYEYKGVPFSAWLFRIATNELNKHYRQEKKMPVYSLEENIALRLSDFEVNQSKELENERLEKLKAILEKLPTKDMQMIELRFFEEKSFKEIGYILDTTESASKMRLYRILEKLKKLF